MPLVKAGVINNSKKTVDKGKMVATFLVGSQALFNFVHDNPMVEMRDVAYTNDPHVSTYYLPIYLGRRSGFTYSVPAIHVL